MNCRLCNQDAVLQQSHVVPEFFYRPIYDEMHRLFPRRGGKLIKGTPLQKGLREQLLCRQCEGQLGEYEKYVCENLFDGTTLASTTNEDRIELAELDYLKVRLFFLSILWRMSVASGQEWRAVHLGPHEERIRSMIHDEQPGDPTEYGFFCVVPLLGGEHSADLLLCPDQRRFERCRFYWLVLGGLVVGYFVSKERMPTTFQQFAITSEGRWALPKRDVTTIEFLFEEAKRIVRG